MDKMLTAGEILRQKRLEKRYSLDEVSAATKIQKHYLEALESNQFDKFPSEVYTKGFLQNYSKFLGVNANKILALYRRSQGEEPPESLEDSPKVDKQPKFVLTPGLILAVTVGIIVIATLGYLIFQFYKFQSPPELRVEAPSKNITVDEEDYTVKGTTEPGMFVTVNDEAVKVDADGTFEVEITLSEGTNTLIIKARHPDNVGREAVVTRNVEYESPDTETPTQDSEDESTDNSQQEESNEDNDNNAEEGQDETDQQQSDKIELVVRVQGAPAWIEIEVDGELVYAATAEAGAEIEFTAENQIAVVSGRLSSTQILINGQEQDLFVTQAGVGAIICEINDSRETNCRQP